jgi:hypothetical protein
MKKKVFTTEDTEKKREHGDYVLFSRAQRNNSTWGNDALTGAKKNLPSPSSPPSSVSSVVKTFFLLRFGAAHG